jgi:flagellin FlaB
MWFTEVVHTWNKFFKDEKGFTGLEAAIVLIAFVVVAAVFSYVMLGAGFFTTQKSQQVVHTGVTQASSSVELTGDVIAKGNAGNTVVNDVTLFLQLTAGGSPIDMAKTLITVSAPSSPPKDLTIANAAAFPSAAGPAVFGITQVYNDNGRNNLLLEKGEKFEVNIALDATILAAPTGTSIEPNGEFQLEIKPPQGATYTIYRTAPPAITPIMTLY